MKVVGIPFEEKLILLYDDDWKTNIAKVSPSARVPVLTDGDLTIWETMAILEYLAERHPDKGLWPEDPAARSMARSIANEMHAGFAALRGNMPMNIRKSHPSKGLGEGVAKDIARIEEIWANCHTRFGAGGDFLFGTFSNADAMFAPVVSRFTTYAVALSDVSAAYRDTVQALPEMIEWSDAGRVEPWTVPHDEID
jgi:glutathione S-transferase